MSFVHLHLHTHYSLLDGLGRPDEYLKTAKEMGMPAAAITDHGSTYGLLDWYKTANKYGVKPILGCETYVARHGRHQKRPGIDAKPYHLILLAETTEGYQNLLQLITLANLEGYYYKPRVDYELLEKYGKGLIALSACMFGEVPSRLLAGDDAGAADAAQRYQKIFGEKNFFLELQDHPRLPDQAAANAKMVELGKRLGLPLVATNDCHYVQPEDSVAHDLLMCIQTNKDANDPKRMRMADANLYFRSPAEMRAAFRDLPEACDNTLKIAERCNVEIELGRRLIPTYATPFNLKPEDYFVELCYDGLNKRFGVPVPEEYRRVDGSEQLSEDLNPKNSCHPERSESSVSEANAVEGPREVGAASANGVQMARDPSTPPAAAGSAQDDSIDSKFASGVGSHVVCQTTTPLTPEFETELIERLEYEIGIILSMGFANYFLIVWDFVKYAKEAGVVVGPGRGSAAGALISYCLGITDLNPLSYGLLFERFLNPERVSMPDIDIDFADDRRDAVLEYVSDKYGRDHVARICTFGTLAAKAAVKDVGRTFGVSFAEMNAFSALIPSKPGTTLADALAAEPQLGKEIEKEPFKTIWPVAVKLEGNIRQVGVHACAVVIADRPLTEYTALQAAPGKETDIITQYNAKPLEDIGLLKMDFLGLRNLTIIRMCLTMIEQNRGDKIVINSLPMDDDKTLELFRQGGTIGVFQFESSGMRRYLKELKPNRFEDLIAMVSLYRPGPMENIPAYIRGKEQPDKVKFPHKVLEEYLRETHGIAVYQEQVQQIAQAFAGFSLGQGYMMIKAVAKKIPALLEEQRALFIDGAVAKGHTKNEAEKLFAIIEPFAGYGFNKSHAACYAYISYQTGYLKAHYPAEFLAALMTSDYGNLDRLTIDIEECNRMGLAVLPPSVNQSLHDFTVVGEGDIRFGLAAIKGLGDGPIEAILAARRAGGAFRDLADFARRVDPSAINKRTLEALAMSGGLDELGERAAIIASAAEIAEFAKSLHAQKNTSQASLFGDSDVAPPPELRLTAVPPAPQSQRLRWEKELLGMYVSSHPLAGLQKYIAKKGTPIGKLLPKQVGQTVNLGGLLTACRKFTTKSSGQQMAFLTLEDPTGVIEVSVFPKTFKEFGHVLVEGEFILASGRLEKRGTGVQLSAYELKKINLDQMREKARESNSLDDSTGRRPPDSETEIEEILPSVPDVSPVEAPPFIIRLTAATDPLALPELKKLLTAAKSETGMTVEILIETEDAAHAKRVRVPFAVGLGFAEIAAIERLTGAEIA